MLSDLQIYTIIMLSAAVWFGLWGAVAGLLIGAIIRPIRTHRFFSILPGLFCAALPAAGIAIVINLAATMAEMRLYYDPYGFSMITMINIPISVTTAQFFAVLTGGVIGAFRALRPQHPPIAGSLMPAFVGGTIGAIALAPFGFMDNDMPPFCDALAGFVGGGLIVLSWCLVTGFLFRAEQKLINGQIEHTI
jgi:hypothetical protein